MRCQICGKDFKVLNLHLLKKHGITPAQYKEKYPNCSLADTAVLKKAGELHGQSILAKSISDPEERKIFYENYKKLLQGYPSSNHAMLESLAWNLLRQFRLHKQFEESLKNNVEGAEKKEQLEKLKTELKDAENITEDFKKLSAALPPKLEFILKLIGDVTPDSIVEMALKHADDFKKIANAFANNENEKGETLNKELLAKFSEKFCKGKKLDSFLQVIEFYGKDLKN